MIRLEARNLTPGWLTLALPVMAVGATLILCSGLILLAGTNPFTAYGILFQSALGSGVNITETLVRAAPLIFTGLAVAVAFRAKFWNIGAEGQLLAGAVVGAWLGALTIPGWLGMVDRKSVV